MNLHKATKIGLFIIILGSLASEISAKSPTVNILRRVFAVRIDTSQGTAFTVDVEGRQYLVTASHLIADTSAIETVSILQDSTWRELRARLVAPLSDGVDVAVFALDQQLSPTHELPASTDGMTMGQEAYFFGFPSMLRTDDEGGINRGYPIPFVKHAIISARERDRFGNGILYLDGHNNPGFSGGPVVFWHQKLDRFCLAGVISGFRPEQLYSPDSTRVLKRTDVYGNSGIVVATEVGAILKLIEQNPVGVPVGK